MEYLWIARTLDQPQLQWSLFFFTRFNFWVIYIPSGWNQYVYALSGKPKFMPRMVIPLVWFSVTEEPVDLQVRICKSLIESIYCGC